MSGDSTVAAAGCDVAVLVSYSGDGGVERMINHLIAGFVDAGCRVDVLVLRTAGGHYVGLPDGVRIRRLGTVHAALAVPMLAWYLRRHRPPVLLAAKDRAGRAAIRARRLARVPTRVFVRIGNTLSQALAGRSALRRRLRYRPIRRLYPRADGIIAISRGVADDIVATTGVDRQRVHVAYNPVITPQIRVAGHQAPPHPWLGNRAVPVVLGVGRLTAQKDFTTLLHAFARVRARRRARLVILGEGEDRRDLEALVARLAIDPDVLMPGFVANPYAWMAHSEVFVLSSAWEGFGNVLVEAMAFGTPVVSTDCRSGPREILAGGEQGALVPVGEPQALARAIEDTLERPVSPDRLEAAASVYTAEHSTARYRKILGLSCGCASAPC